MLSSNETIQGLVNKARIKVQSGMETRGKAGGIKPGVVMGKVHEEPTGKESAEALDSLALDNGAKRDGSRKHSREKAGAEI